MRKLALALVLALALPSHAIYVTFYTATNTSMVLRHCSYQLFAAPSNVTAVKDGDKMWEIVRPPFNSTAPEEYIGLRSANFADLYICIDDTGSAVTLAPTSSNKASCTFEMVSGLSDPNHISFKQSGKYLSLATTLLGTCATSYKYWTSPAADVQLLASPKTAAHATWIKVNTPHINIISTSLGYGVRHCSFIAYATVVESNDDDFRWIAEPGLNSSVGTDAISFRSTNFPIYHLGWSGTHVVPMDCTSVPETCTWVKTVLGTSTGYVSLYHPHTGLYLSVSSTITGCTWKTGGDLILSNTSYSWYFTGANPGILNSGTFNVSAIAAQKTINPLLYGSFFEEINFAGEGGLYAELIRNRDFEALGRGTLGDNKNASGRAVSTDYRPWVDTLVHGNATVQIAPTSGPYSTNANALAVYADAADYKVELVNPGFWGIKCVTGMSYKGSFWAKSSAAANITIYLRNGSSIQTTKTTFQLKNSTSWSKHNYSLVGTANKTTEFVMVVESDDSADVLLDVISLFPEDAVKGIFRKDLFDLVYNLKPSFMRFPGGNYLMGKTLKTRWDWKATLGNADSRAGHYNEAWGYWSTDGLGIYEYFLLCEALDTKPIFSVFTGYTLDGNYTAMSNSTFLHDPVDALEFATGLPNSTWGKKRADLGHSAPFTLDMMEIGNEEYFMTAYKLRYQNITDALWSVSNITAIASGRWTGSDSSIAGGPCVSPSNLRCDIWDDHYYFDPDAISTMAAKYDSYDLSIYPQVFVGEYAANSESTQTTRSALAEAAFMIGFERNADVVQMSSFAPLFSNVNSPQWSFVAINFDHEKVFLNPFYHVQKLFNDNLCSHTISSASKGFTASIACITDDDALIIKIVNFASTGQLTTFALTALGSNKSYSGSYTVMSSFAGDMINTIAYPDNVYPTTSSVTVTDKAFLFVPGWSVALLRVNNITVAASSSSSSSGHISSSSNDQQAVVDNSSEAVTDTCLAYSTCRSCLHTRSCGWCGSLSQCISSSSGDRPSQCTSEWHYDNCGSSSNNVGAIVGGVVGGFSAICIMSAALAFIFVSRKNSRKQAPNLPLEFNQSVDFVPAESVNTNTFNSSGLHAPTGLAGGSSSSSSSRHGGSSGAGGSNNSPLDVNLVGAIPSSHLKTDIDISGLTLQLNPSFAGFGSGSQLNPSLSAMGSIPPQYSLTSTLPDITAATTLVVPTLPIQNVTAISPAGDVKDAGVNSVLPSSQ